MMKQALFGLLVMLPLLHGCAPFPLLVGGVATTGVLVAEDRRTIGTITEDQAIEFKIASRVSERYKDSVNVNVTSFNRVALLTGEVPDEAAKAEVERIARSVENVKDAHNELTVAGASSVTVRTSDTLITTSVKARFVDARKFNPLHVKVITEIGVVFLMGLVKRQEADDASEIARTTSGVQKVVRIFEYLD